MEQHVASSMGLPVAASAFTRRWMAATVSKLAWIELAARRWRQRARTLLLALLKAPAGDDGEEEEEAEADADGDADDDAVVGGRLRLAQTLNIQRAWNVRNACSVQGAVNRAPRGGVVAAEDAGEEGELGCRPGDDDADLRARLQVERRAHREALVSSVSQQRQLPVGNAYSATSIASERARLVDAGRQQAARRRLDGGFN